MASSIFVNVGGGSSSGGGALPTAPLGQVLISQGAGIPPIFSNKPILTTSSGPANQRSWRIGTENDGNLHFRLLDDAGNPGAPRVQIDPFGGGVATVNGGFGAVNGGITAKIHTFVD